MSFFKDRPVWLAPWARVLWWILSFLALYGFGHQLYVVISTKTPVKATQLPGDISFALICVGALAVIVLIHLNRPYGKN